MAPTASCEKLHIQALICYDHNPYTGTVDKNTKLF